jgi:hypothetical protein
LGNRCREDTVVPETIQCDKHGESEKTYICVHLKGDDAGLGFNRDEPSDEDPFPDAWCDACEIVRAEYGGWEGVPDGLCQLALLCSGCYERACILHTRPTTTFEDLSNLRWKCGHCEEWHSGPCLDFVFPEPSYWDKSRDKGTRWQDTPGSTRVLNATFLDDDYCCIGGESFFVRGIIHLPIVGTAGTFRWGVWGSLSRQNFEKLLIADDDPARVDLPPMFSWLSSKISDYPDTLNMKMFAHIQEPGIVPNFRLERCDHPLAREYHHGIMPDRVREIMLNGLPALEQ